MIDLFVMSKSDENRFIKQKFHVRWLDQHVHDLVNVREIFV
jgi:hypothetical protein